MSAASSAPRADLREGGTWSWSQRLKNDVIVRLVQVGVAAASRLPAETARGLGIALGALAHGVLSGTRRRAVGNVLRALPELDDGAARALVLRTFRALGAELGDAAASLSPSRAPLCLPFAQGSEATLTAALSEGRGVLLASAHLGPWEAVAASLAARGIPLTVVAREPYDPRLAFVYDRLRGGRAVRAVYRGRPGAAASMLRILRRGEVLGIPMDLRSRVPSLDVPFFGIPAPTPTGPARLALRTGASVVVATAAPAAGGLVLAVSKIVTDDLDPKDWTSIPTLTARLNDELTARIRALPDRWPWMHDRWPAEGR